MNTHDYSFLLSERATLNKLIDQVSPSDVIGRMSLQARLEEVKEGINAYEGSSQQLGEGRPTFQGRRVDYGSGYAAPVSLPAQQKDKITMRLAEPMEKAGFFWLPEDTENRVPGILRISESGKITLEVFCLSDPMGDVIGKRRLGGPLYKAEDGNLERIVGIIDNESITLDGIYIENAPLLVIDDAVSTSTMYADRAFLGVKYDKEEEVAFSELRFSVDGLDEWLPTSGLRVGYNPKDGSVHSKEIALNLPDEIELKSIFEDNKAYISLKSKKLRPIEYFLDLVSKLHNLLCFAIDKAVSLDSVTGYSSEITQFWNEKKYETPIKVYYRSVPYSEEKSKNYWPVFIYNEVADQFEKILTKWIENYEIYEPAFNLYFASVSSGQKYLEWKFLSLAQGIETLHRRNSQEMEMPEEEFVKIKENVLGVTPDEKQEWLETRLKYANELSLRKRIKQMINPFKDLFGNSREHGSFIRKVVDTRNYLTHYDSGLETKAASREDLWKLCMKLEALFQLHFLLLIGMDIESIKSIANKNPTLRDKLGLEC